MELFVTNKQEGLSAAERMRLCRLRKEINAEKQQQVSDANKNMVSCSINKNKRKGEKLSNAEYMKRYRATKKAEKQLQQQHQASTSGALTVCQQT